MSDNFWPNIEIEKIETPVSVLKEQAKELEKVYKGILKGEVVLNTQENRFHHVFYIIAPLLDNYRYPLLEVVHKIDMYPLLVYDNNKKRKPISPAEKMAKTFSSFSESSIMSSEYAFSGLPEPDYQILDLDSFKKTLKAIFSSDDTKTVIQNLISQSR
jgi:hypothetical protein